MSGKALQIISTASSLHTDLFWAIILLFTHYDVFTSQAQPHQQLHFLIKATFLNEKVIH